MRNTLILSLVTIGLVTSCTSNAGKKYKSTDSGTKIERTKVELPSTIKTAGVAQNPEGIEFDKNDNTFLLSSLNASPIIKVNSDGTYKAFTSGEPYPMSTAGLQIDYKNNRLLVAGFNGMELYDQDPATKGTSNLRIYNLEAGAMEKDINLSSLVTDAQAYMDNDITVDNEGNAYISDWFAGFDGMVLSSNGKVVGVTNNGKTPGGNTFIELSSDDNWNSATVINNKTITPSTTVAITAGNSNFVIHQDFMSNEATNWTIERIEF